MRIVLHAFPAGLPEEREEPPATPQPAGPPPTPHSVSGEVRTDGTVRLKWAGSLTHGTFFSVWRKTGSTWQNIASVAKKSFVDEGLPPSCGEVWYHIRAHRGDHSPERPASPASFSLGNYVGEEALPEAA